MIGRIGDPWTIGLPIRRSFSSSKRIERKQICTFFANGFACYQKSLPWVRLTQPKTTSSARQRTTRKCRAMTTQWYHLKHQKQSHKSSAIKAIYINTLLRSKVMGKLVENVVLVMQNTSSTEELWHCTIIPESTDYFTITTSRWSFRSVE